MHVSHEGGPTRGVVLGCHLSSGCHASASRAELTPLPESPGLGYVPVVLLPGWTGTRAWAWPPSALLSWGLEDRRCHPSDWVWNVAAASALSTTGYWTVSHVSRSRGWGPRAG